MENKNAVILVLAIVAALLIAASATYAMMGRQVVNTGNANYGYGTGPSMMGRSAGYPGGMMGGYTGGYGGMMGGHGMMDDFNGTSSMYQYMQQTRQCWNSTSTP